MGANAMTVNYLGSKNYSASTSGSMMKSVGMGVGILLLDKTGSGALTDSGNGLVQVINGTIDVDSCSASAIVVSGSADIYATQINDAGGDSIKGNGAITGVLDTHTSAAVNPLESLAAPDLTMNKLVIQSSSALNIGGTSIVTLCPGVYVGGINVGGSAKVTLNPGIYYLQGGGFIVSGTAAVTDLGKGVLLYNAAAKSTDSINIGGSGSVTLSPMASGLYQG